MSVQSIDPEYVTREIRPLFSRTLKANEGKVYLANHSLGRPLDAVQEALKEFSREWETRLDTAWEPESWPNQVTRFKCEVAKLVGCSSPDSVIPKTSAGQGLRAVLNAFPVGKTIQVVSTEGEFDSIHHILGTYHVAGRAHVSWIKPRTDQGSVPLFSPSDVIDKIKFGTDLVVLSAVFFTTGQVMHDLDLIINRAHEVGAKVVLDVYHALGVLPFDMQRIDADFVIGGCYKYLRGGPGACFLVVSKKHLDTDDFRSLDTGWFAKESPFSYSRPDPPRRASGGDSWAESTPPIVTMYQAVPGLEFVNRIGIDRIRQYNLNLQAQLIEGFKAEGLPVFAPEAPENFGAFVLLPHPDTEGYVERLKEHMVIVDARGGFVRFGPDLLTTDKDVELATRIAAKCWV